MSTVSERIEFSLLSFATRLVYVVFSISSFAVLVLDRMENGNSLFPLAVGFVCLGLSLVEDAWRFDTERNIVSHRIGLTFAAHSSSWNFSDVRSIHASRFERGFRKTVWMRITVEFVDGSTKVVEIAPEKKIAPLIERLEKQSDLSVQN